MAALITAARNAVLGRPCAHGTETASSTAETRRRLIGTVLEPQVVSATAWRPMARSRYRASTTFHPSDRGLIAGMTMAQLARTKPPVADERLRKLDQIAADVIAAREAIVSLEGQGFEGLRTRADLLLEEIARCLARELGPAHAPGAGPPPGDRTD